MNESAPNNSSVAMLITVAGLRLFLAADMEAPAQEELLSYLLSHREIRVGGRQAPARAHHAGHTVIKRDGNVLCVGDIRASGFAHRTIVHRGIHAYRLGRLQTPHHEIEVVRGFHRCG